MTPSGVERPPAKNSGARPGVTTSGGGCPAAAQRDAAGRGLDVRVDERREARGLDLVDERVEVVEQRRRGHPRAGERAHGAPQLPHRARGGDAAPDDVADADRDAAVGQRERVVPVAAHLEMRHRGAVGGRDLVARVGRQRAREQALLQRARDVALELVEPHALERERRLLGAGAQERALVRRELVQATERHGEPPAAVRREPRTGAAAAGLAGVVPGGAGERVRRQRPVDRQHLELAAALAQRDAGPARAEVLRQLARDRRRDRRGGRRRGERRRDPLQPLHPLARLTLAVPRGEQLLLVALAVGRVEHRRAHDLPAHPRS